MTEQDKRGYDALIEGTGGHTPGPWIVNPFVAQVDCQRISEQGGLLPVCQMLWPTDERSEAETEANARLIARAPQMAEAISTLLRERDALVAITLTNDEWSCEDLREIARAALSTKLTEGEADERGT